MKVQEILKHRDTGSHGYFSFRAKFENLNNNVPESFRQNEYEEDCEWAIPLFFNFNLLTCFKEKRQVISTMLNWNLEAYESTGRIANRKISGQKDKLMKFAENKGLFFSVVGYGSWCYDIPKDCVYRGFVLNNGNEDSSRSGNVIHAILKESEDNKEFYTPEFIKERAYDRDKTYYTWDEYTTKTGKQRFK